MSDDSSMEDIVSALSSLTIANQVQIAALALLYYDWIIVLPTEITQIWLQKFTAASALYLCARYMTLLSWALSTSLGFIPGSATSCIATYYTYYTLGYLSTISVKLVFILHTCAIYQKNKLLVCCLILAALVPLLGDLSLYWEEYAVYSPTDIPGIGGCNVNANPGILRWYPVAIWGNVAFNIIISLFTLFKTYEESREANKHGLPVTSRIHILRDGSIYFLVFAILGITNAIVFKVVPAENPAASIVSSFSSVLQASLICRLVLNIRNLLQDPLESHRHYQSFTVLQPRLQYSSAPFWGLSPQDTSSTALSTFN